jgi:hypothetical protein
MTSGDWVEDPAVAVIEQIFAEAAARSAKVPRRDGKIVADRAVWFCACATLETYDPTWLIYDTDDAAFGWTRVPDGTNVGGLIRASAMTGDHVDPQQVLDWLQGGEKHSSHYRRGAGNAITLALRETINRLRRD